VQNGIAQPKVRPRPGTRGYGGSPIPTRGRYHPILDEVGIGSGRKLGMVCCVIAEASCPVICHSWPGGAWATFSRMRCRLSAP